jgi:DNA-binding beta-propeller fold protein YncE
MTLGASTVVPTNPPHVAMNPAGTVAYVAIQTNRAVEVINASSGTVTASIALPAEAFNLIVSRDGSRLYVTTNGTKLYVISTASNTVVDSVTVGTASNGLAFHPSQPVLYVSSILDGTVSAVNTQTLTVTRTYAVGGRLQRIAVAPSGKELYVANEDQGLDIIDVASGAVTPVSLADVGGVPSTGLGLAMTPDGEYVYVGMANWGRVKVVETATRLVYRTILGAALTDPRNIAIAPNGTVVVADQAGSVHFIR